MRKILLITAMVLISGAAEAGRSRSLSLASADERAVSTQTSPADAPATTATASTQPLQIDSAKPAAPLQARANRPKHRNTWTEARIISELHRHGIYW